MNDNELIEQIAQLWVSCGGDELGFDYCAEMIKDKISEILEERDIKESEDKEDV